MNQISANWIYSSTVGPSYIDHSRETKIGSMWRVFVISEHSLRPIKSKGNEKPFDIDEYHR